MAKQTIISLDPIDRKKNLGLFGTLIKSRWHSGKKPKKQEPYGHYMFCGAQRSGKSVGAIWYMERLYKKYKRKGYNVIVYSNMGIGKPIIRNTLYDIIDKFDPYAKEVRIVLIDEIHTYFPKDGGDKNSQVIRDNLINIFSQLAKRNTYVISTAQVYGRVDKKLREQCLYMINCKKTISGKFKNEFIKGDDILCDELGRWAGRPTVIHIHGLQKTNYDTKLLIRE